MSLYELIIYFTIYSFIGWVCEVTYCSVLSRRIVNRGFLAGPVCPVYGFGGLLVIYLMKPAEAGIPAVFLAGLALTSILEYITGWLLEVFFRTKWWDYSNQRFNLNGRVCLKNSVLFGGMCVVLVKALFPATRYMVGQVPERWVQITGIILYASFAIDVLFTVNTLVNLNERLKKLHEFTEDLKKNTEIPEWFNEHELFKSFEKLKLLAEDGKNELNQKLREKFEALSQRRGSGHRLIKAFPNMKSIKYEVQLKHLKDNLKQLREKAGRIR